MALMTHYIILISLSFQYKTIKKRFNKFTIICKIREDLQLFNIKNLSQVKIISYIQQHILLGWLCHLMTKTIC